MKILLSLFLSFFCCCCSWSFLPEKDQVTIQDCAFWCSDYNNINYRDDRLEYKTEDYWQTPDETRNKKTGDCEDICALFLDMCKKREYKNLELYFVIIEKSGHMVASVDGKIYDITKMMISHKFEVYDNIDQYVKYNDSLWKYKISFEAYLDLSEKYHDYHYGYGVWN